MSPTDLKYLFYDKNGIKMCIANFCRLFFTVRTVFLSLAFLLVLLCARLSKQCHHHQTLFDSFIIDFSSFQDAGCLG